MGLYDQLPVYQASYDLLVSIFDFSRNFTREYKYTIGEKLKSETVDLITHIYRANSRPEKGPVIQQARENVEVIRLYMRLLRDLQQVSIRQFVDINEKIEDVSRQLTGWQKSLR
jgi:hypothetical protein